MERWIWITAAAPGELTPDEIATAASQGIVEIWHGVPPGWRSTIDPATTGAYLVVEESAPPVAETEPNRDPVTGERIDDP